MAIHQVVLKKTMNSKNEPTVEAEISLRVNGEMVKGTGSSPQGTSAGKYEAVFAPNNVDTLIAEFPAEKLEGFTGTQEAFDRKLHEIDGTENFSKIGACVSLSLSSAFAKGMAATENTELYEYLFKGDYGIPRQLAKCIGGGVHAQGKGPDIQEFLVVPLETESFADTVDTNKEIYDMVKENSGATETDFEGGWIVGVENEKALDIISKAIDETGKKVVMGLDVAANEFYKDEKYVYARNKKALDAGEQLEYMLSLAKTYGLYYIEDPFNEEDFQMHAELTKKTGCMVCGDDLFATNTKRLQKGIGLKACNTLIIKPNQAGTITDTVETVKLAKKNNYDCVVSHRSGETNDVLISHLAVAFRMPIIKVSVSGKSEYGVKIDELKRIEKYKW